MVIVSFGVAVLLNELNKPIVNVLGLPVDPELVVSATSTVELVTAPIAALVLSVDVAEKLKYPTLVVNGRITLLVS